MTPMTPMSAVTDSEQLSFANTRGVPFDDLRLHHRCSVFNFVDKDGESHEGVVYLDHTDDEPHWRMVTKSMNISLLTFGATSFKEAKAEAESMLDEVVFKKIGIH
jgi:hypothetical protein